MVMGDSGEVFFTAEHPGSRRFKLVVPRLDPFFFLPTTDCYSWVQGR